MPKRVFITVAEVSGDRHAAQLVRALRELDPSVRVEGLGGPEMAAASATVHRETVGNAAMGLLEAEAHTAHLLCEMYLRLEYVSRAADLRFQLPITQAELAEVFGVGRSTIYRTLERIRPAPPEPQRPFAHLSNPQPTKPALTPPTRSTHNASAMT